MGPCIWITNSGCEVCDALAGYHAQPPHRPHPFCQCTLIDVSTVGGPRPGRCLYDDHLLLMFRTDGTGTKWNSEEQVYDHIQINVDVLIQCKDGSLVSASYVYEYEDLPEDRFPFSNNEDHSTFFDIIIDQAYAQWEGVAEDACPSCE